MLSQPYIENLSTRLRRLLQTGKLRRKRIDMEYFYNNTEVNLGKNIVI